jgi:hypothetical protein
MDEKEKAAVLFFNLVGMFQSLAWQQMGKLKNPLTDKVERNLEGARSLIDTIDMIRMKTKGNLSADEEKFLTEVLRELRLNYLEEAKKGDEVSERESGAEEGG